VSTLERKKVNSIKLNSQIILISIIYKATSFENNVPNRPDDPPLLPGEKVTGQARDVTYLCPYYGPARGVLTVTNYKLYFRSADKDTPNIIDVPLGVVSIYILAISTTVIMI
jgi:myotubularin-related protein 1/2